MPDTPEQVKDRLHKALQERHDRGPKPTIVPTHTSREPMKGPVSLRDPEAEKVLGDEPIGPNPKIKGRLFS